MYCFELDVFTQVITNDTGLYGLNVYSQAFSMNYSIVFEIIVNLKSIVSTDSTSVIQTDPSTVLTGFDVFVILLVTTGALFLMSLIANGFLLVKTRKERKSPSKGFVDLTSSMEKKTRE